MKLTTSAFHNDYLHLTLFDIVLLLCGRKLKDGALVVSIRNRKKPTP